MNLIKISDNILINPDKISAVVMSNDLNGEKVLKIIIDTVEYPVTVKPIELLKDLMKTGMENLTWQYWAG